MDTALRAPVERGGAVHARRTLRSVGVLSALLLLTRTSSAEGQALRGRLIDRATEGPVPGAILTLHGDDSTVVASVVSDASGRFTLRVPQRGDYVINVRRLGYRPYRSGSTSVPVSGDSVLTIRLDRLAAQLDPVQAQAAAIRRSLELSGFYERQKSNFGHFVTPEAIERRQASRVTDLLTTIPGVQVFASGSGSVGPPQIALRGGSMNGGSLCSPRVFVDGLIYTRGDSRPVRANGATATEQAGLEERIDHGLSLDDIGHPSTIVGIEVYRSAAQVPVQFGGTSRETLCGVIVIWTKSGQATGRQ